MALRSVNARQQDAASIGGEIYRLIEDLYPICRSITGDGYRKSLQRIAQEIPLSTCELPTGTQVFDWTIPKEWNIRDAYVKNVHGDRIIDFRRHNLHVVSYSVPVHRTMRLQELEQHLYSLPDQPDLIPYRTSYYRENWGFCLPHRQRLELKDEEYEVCIDSTLCDGHLTYGEYLVPGNSFEEVLVSCHACHPSLCNDNLSGIGVATWLAKHLAGTRNRYSYRFIFIPGTIGSIAWLALNESRVEKIRHGVVLSCVGDRGGFSYKKSRRGDTEVDRAFANVIRQSGRLAEIQEFSPYGYDERQYCSPGFNLPVGCLMRTPHSRFPEYHTSADNLHFVDRVSLGESFNVCMSVFNLLENNRAYLNRNPKCEPQLGKRGLYDSLGGRDIKSSELAMLWALNLSDGTHTLLDIAERSGMEFSFLAEAAYALCAQGLLQELA